MKKIFVYLVVLSALMGGCNGIGECSFDYKVVIPPETAHWFFDIVCERTSE